MKEEPRKYDFDVFQRITNALLINSAFIDNIGLLHGKMGIAIFFAHLFGETKDPLFEKMFDMLIDEVFDGITITTTPDFEDGLAGIGWGIEYLVEKGFIDANSDEVLETLDRKIGQILPYDVDNVGLLTGYCGYGLYLVKRIKNGPANRRKVKKEELERLLELVITGIDKSINDNKVDLVEPTKFDLSWDVLVLLLFIKEISSIERFSSWAADHDNFFCSLAERNYLLPENRMAVAILSGKQLEKGDVSYLLGLSGLRRCAFNDGFVRFCTLLCLLYGNKHRLSLSEILSYLRHKLTSIMEGLDQRLSGWKGSKDLGFLEGLCGLALGLLLDHDNTDYRIARTLDTSKPLFLHPKEGKTDMTVVFVPYEHSGAGTYKEELVSYLREQQGVELYVLSISKNLDEYAFESLSQYIHIKIPILDRPNEIHERLLKEYFARVVILLKNDCFIPEGAIYHFNHYTDYDCFIPVINKELKGKAILTYHFLNGMATIMTLRQELSLNSDENETNWEDIQPGNPRLFDGIICVSQFAQRVLTGYYKIPKEKTTVVWNGTSSWNSLSINQKEKGSLKEYFGLDPKKRVILYSGRLEPRKGIEEYLDVARRLCDKYDDLHFVFAGNGNFEDYLPMCKGFLDNVSFTGNIGKEDLQRLYYLAELGVVPSRWEIFGYVPIEMMHSGLPVVATNVPGMNEIFGQFPYSDYLVDVKLNNNKLEVDRDQLFRVISILLDNPILLKEHANNGLVCAKSHFCRIGMGDKTIEFYNKNLKHNG